DHAGGGGVVVGGIADGGLLDGQVDVEEHADIAVLAFQVADLQGAQEDRLVEVDGVVGDDLQPQAQVQQPDLGDQRAGAVRQVPFPAVVLQPGELAVRPDAEALHLADGVVVAADAGEVDVADAVEPV